MAQPTTPPDLSDTIRDALKRGGFPFELRVEREFAKADFSTVVAAGYADPESKKLREFDVLALRGHGASGSIDDTTIYFCCECKTGSAQAWVVFSSPRARIEPEFYREAFPCSSRGRYFLEHMKNDPEIGGQLLFQPPKRTASSLVAVQGKGKIDSESCFGAVTQAVSAAVAKSIERGDFSANLGPNVVAFPVVVTDRPLFEAYLDGDSADLTVEPIEHAVIAWRRRVRGTVVVHVVTESFLAEFVRRAAIASEILVTKAKTWALASTPKK